jgi:hypothetical protein
MAEEISPLENHGWWMERLRKDAKANRPEALLLADELEAPLGTVISGEVDRRAAIELRRLHAEVNELKRTLALQQKSYEREIQIEVEAEREACAKVCDARYMGDNNREDMEARRCAAAIRARGQE